jgi:hypothetical protein
MTTDSFFALAVVSVLTLFFGFVLAFGGYRFLAALLPLLGFVFGFAFGALTVQALLGDGFLSTLSSWLIGFLFAVSFAAASYLVYFMAISMATMLLGFGLGAGLMEAIGFDFGFLVWLVGLVCGLALTFAVLKLNVQKYAVIAATALLGSGVIAGTFLFLFGDLSAADLGQNPVRHALQTAPLLFVVFLAVAVLGAVAQYLTTRHWEAVVYDRLTGDLQQGLVPATPPTTS